jgi:hypothetical protein
MESRVHAADVVWPACRFRERGSQRILRWLRPCPGVPLRLQWQLAVRAVRWHIIEADEEAADVFFRHARLDQLETLALIGYSAGYWGREGQGRSGLRALIASGLLQRMKHLRLQLLPLFDGGVLPLPRRWGSSWKPASWASR